MVHFSKMVDMAITPADVKEDMQKSSPFGGPIEPSMESAMDREKYPYNLCIHLTKHEIEKLDLDIDDVEEGDMLHFCGMAIVKDADHGIRDTVGGKTEACPRIELQITHLGVEDEEEENREATPNEERAKKRYGEEEPVGEEEYEEPEQAEEVGELHIERHDGPAGGKAAKKAVHDPGEVHLSKKNYKAA